MQGLRLLATAALLLFLEANAAGSQQQEPDDYDDNDEADEEKAAGNLSAEDLFRDCDTNHDNKLSKREFVRPGYLKEEFYEHDTNGDRLLSFDEFSRWYKIDQSGQPEDYRGDGDQESIAEERLRWYCESIPAILSDVALLLAYCALLFRTIAANGTELGDVSLQCLLTYAVVHFSRIWFSRWASALGDFFGDTILNLVSVTVCTLLVVRRWKAANLFLEVPFGSELVQTFWGVGGRMQKAVSWLILYVLCVFLAIIMLIITPQAVLADDRQFGVSSFADSYHASLDTLSILPQFASFHSQQNSIVPPVLVPWIVGLAVSRFFAFMSGAGGVYVAYVRSHQRYVYSELTFLLSQIFNLVILSDFIYCFCKSKIRKTATIEILV